jgi:hypothetical protein
VPQVWNRNGEPDGVVIFVKIDCTTRDPLPPDQQDPGQSSPLSQSRATLFLPVLTQLFCTPTVYQQPGVPLDRGTRDAILAFQMQGYNFSAAQLGDQGDNLLNWIDSYTNGSQAGCIWNFTTETGGEWDWIATGCIPLTVDPYILGQSMMNIGGNTADGCVNIP